MNECLHCGAETSNGLALCELCRRRATDCLTDLPVYFRNLARWQRPGRPNGSLGTRGQWLIRQGEIDPSLLITALERAANDVETWTRALAEDRDVPMPDAAETEAATFAGLCELLAVHVTSVATLEWAGQFVRDLDRHERRLRGLTEAAVPGWYAGTCRRRIGEDVCGAPTYVLPGLTWVTCRACGATTFARDHLDAVLDEARGWVAPPKRIAEALVALLDDEDSVPKLHDRIRKWDSLGWIAGERSRDADGDEVGPKRYRLGDVLDTLAAETPRQAMAERMQA